ncbi:hypothetical protein DMC30DRAFT_303619 [Rhodotorula diobovata]|uniref:Uncharacterized protein n=1 Tax=Rhodotorula diobovata TaxID=5288 RepID=A0A5C5FRF4_9BASI|nr:hypothetical protein DMC30DRAFT_303619 [Rhodotorula diobovata]
MPPPPPSNGSSHLNGAHPASHHSDSDADADEYDPVSFQAALDDSVSQARDLVSSWLPANLGKEWDNAFSSKTGQDGLQGLKDRARPPRLGLGAQPASLHKQLAEDRKIAARLLRGRPTSIGDEGANVRVRDDKEGAERGASSEEEDDDDDEESRSRAVGKKARSGAGSGYANPFVMPNGKGTPVKAGKAGAKAGAPPLFNDPSPAKPSPSSSAPSTSASGLMAPIKASSSFYSGATSATANGTTAAAGAPALQGLTKNQRKKERERLRRDEERRRREEESRAEAEAEVENGEASGAGQKRARDEGGDGDDADVADGDASMADDASASAPASPSRASEAGKGAGSDSPKKRRKKKKKKGGEGAAAAGGGGAGAGDAPLLNLAPLGEGS